MILVFVIYTIGLIGAKWHLRSCYREARTLKSWTRFLNIEVIFMILVFVIWLHFLRFLLSCLAAKKKQSLFFITPRKSILHYTTKPNLEMFDISQVISTDHTHARKRRTIVLQFADLFLLVWDLSKWPGSILSNFHS